MLDLLRTALLAPASLPALRLQVEQAHAAHEAAREDTREWYALDAALCTVRCQLDGLVARPLEPWFSEGRRALWRGAVEGYAQAESAWRFSLTMKRLYGSAEVTR